MNWPVVKVIEIKDIPSSLLKQLTLKYNDNMLTVVTGDHYELNQLGFFIPEGEIVSEKLLREMWLWNDELNKGRLAGKKGNRVKSRNLDGINSTGLFYGATFINKGTRVNSQSWNSSWTEGYNVLLDLGDQNAT